MFFSIAPDGQFCFLWLCRYGEIELTVNPAGLKLLGFVLVFRKKMVWRGAPLFLIWKWSLPSYSELLISISKCK